MSKPPVDSAVVISLTSTPERLNLFRAGWLATGIATPIREHVFAPDDNRVRGCFQSHLTVLAEATGPLAVFEDDAVFAESFTLDIDWPDDADIGYVGGEHLSWPAYTGIPGVLSSMAVRRTHGYVVWDPQRLAVMLDTYRDHLDAIYNQLPLNRYAVDPFTVGQRLRSSRHAEFWQAYGITGTAP